MLAFVLRSKALPQSLEGLELVSLSNTGDNSAMLECSCWALVAAHPKSLLQVIPHALCWYFGSTCSNTKTHCAAGRVACLEQTVQDMQASIDTMSRRMADLEALVHQLQHQASSGTLGTNCMLSPSASFVFDTSAEATKVYKLSTCRYLGTWDCLDGAVPVVLASIRAQAIYLGSSLGKRHLIEVIRGVTNWSGCRFAGSAGSHETRLVVAQ